MTALSRSLMLLLVMAVISVWSAPAAAQDPPPRIGPFVVDLHGTVPRFTQNQQLADSRGVLLSELPGSGFGLHGGAHVYLFKLKAVTFGVGVDLAIGGSHQDAIVTAVDTTTTPPTTTSTRAVDETFKYAAPVLSLNFGTGDGWSYLSAGIGTSIWSIVPEGETPDGASTERIRTVNYGGGARWFVNRHVAFSVDARFYQIDPTTPVPPRGDGPRTTILVIGAGISLK